MILIIISRISSSSDDPVLDVLKNVSQLPESVLLKKNMEKIKKRTVYLKHDGMRSLSCADLHSDRLEEVGIFVCYVYSGMTDPKLGRCGNSLVQHC